MGKLNYSQYGRSLVNGAFVNKTERSFTVYNPANKQKVVDVQEAGAKGACRMMTLFERLSCQLASSCTAEVDAAVDAAQAAFPAWVGHQNVDRLSRRA